MEVWQMSPQPGTDEWREYMGQLERNVLQEKIWVLERKEYIAESNVGTYGEAEAIRCVGTADPQFANSVLYITLTGRKRRVGCARKNAPGYWRYPSRAELQQDSKEIKLLRKKLAESFR